MPTTALAFVGVCVLYALSAGCSQDTCASGDCAVDGGGGTGSGGEGGVAAPDLPNDYCDCMLLSCHDAYHATFGPETDEPLARSVCLSEAADLAEAGMDVDSGDFIECRLHYCELGEQTDEVCAAAVGESFCAP